MVIRSYVLWNMNSTAPQRRIPDTKFKHAFAIVEYVVGHENVGFIQFLPTGPGFQFGCSECYVVGEEHERGARFTLAAVRHHPEKVLMVIQHRIAP